MSSTVVMPEDLSVGFISRPTFSTDKNVMVNGQESRFPNRSMVIHRYTFDQENVETSMIAALRAFWFSRRGDFHAFLMKDWADFELKDEMIGLGDGIANSFQAQKVYGTDVPYVRILRHLIPGFTIKLSDVVVNPADYVEAEGIVTFDTPPGSGAITITGGFYVPVRFDGDQFPVAVPYGDRNVMTVQGVEAIEIVP